MDHHFKQYFHEFSEERPSGNFHKVIALHEKQDHKWEEIKTIAPVISKGWWELSKLNKIERIDLLQQYWEKKMELFPKFCKFIAGFFSDLDDIGIYLTQKTFDDSFDVQMVYSLKDNVGFFRGHPPATDESIARLKNEFSGVIFPEDYLAFQQIHNGFYKTTDSTGLTKTNMMKPSYETFQKFFTENEVIHTGKGIVVNPRKLIPFYTSFGMPFYQCFWEEWYPEQEMGNVYCSINTKTVSNICDAEAAEENLSFPSFSDWLTFYLERVDK
jgi:hypothetical protein